MEPHLSTLQDIVRLTIQQEIEWSERRFKRVAMSHDASNNPAELYGVDGKIYYRKEGGAGAELGTGGAALWELGVTGVTPTINPITWTDVCIDDMWIKDLGADTTGDLTIWTVRGGGGGGHPHETVE